MAGIWDWLSAILGGQAQAGQAGGPITDLTRTGYGAGPLPSSAYAYPGQHQVAPARPPQGLPALPFLPPGAAPPPYGPGPIAHAPPTPATGLPMLQAQEPPAISVQDYTSAYGPRVMDPVGVPVPRPGTYAPHHAAAPRHMIPPPMARPAMPPPGPMPTPAPQLGTMMGQQGGTVAGPRPLFPPQPMPAPGAPMPLAKPRGKSFADSRYLFDWLAGR
jgi:hypothetical protein